MLRPLFVVLFLLVVAMPRDSARAEGREVSNEPSVPKVVPPEIEYVHLGTTTAHVKPLAPGGTPIGLEMQLRNRTTGVLISSGWEAYLWERGSWQFDLSPERAYCFDARARDALGFVSLWGPTKCATTGDHYYATLETPVSDQYVLFEVALPDLDGDGHLDFFGAVSDDEDQPTLFARQPDDTFLDVTPPELAELSSSAIFGDWDNDGDADVYQMRRVFLQNDGAPSFTDLSADIAAVLPAATWSGRSPQAWVDLDGDGWLELFVTSSTETRALKRTPTGGFVVLPGSSLTGFSSILCIDFADHDRDGDADLCVVDAWGARFYANDGSGNLVWIDYGALFIQTTVASWGDLDDDGYPDLAVSNPVRGVEIAMNLGGGQYQKQVGRIVGDPLLPEPNGTSVSTASGLRWADADNDADLDLLVQRGSETGTVLCRNDGSGVLVAPNDCYPELLCGLRLDTDVATGDLDEDGVLDVFLPGTALAYGQDGIDTAGRNWTVLHLVGTPPSNRMAVGARVSISAGGVTQHRQVWATAPRGSQSSPFVHFGLGTASTIAAIEITWPSGNVQKHDALPVNRRLTITEGEIITAAGPFSGAGTTWSLSPGRPNPFGGSTEFAFELPRTARVEAGVYDVQGRLVRSLANEAWTQGPHVLRWDGRNSEGRLVAGGVYFLRVRANGEERTQRAVFLR